jgi:hypothetical protein
VISGRESCDFMIATTGQQESCGALLNFQWFQVFVVLSPDFAVSQAVKDVVAVVIRLLWH